MQQEIIKRKDIYTNSFKKWNKKYQKLLTKAIETEKRLKKLIDKIKRHQENLTP